MCTACDEEGEGSKDGKAGLRAYIEADTLAGPAPLDVSFQLHVEGAGIDEELVCQWDFGDGHRLQGCIVRHVFVRAAADPYLVQAAVTSRATGRTATAQPVRISVHEQADLAVSGVLVEPLQVQAGDPLTVSFQVANQGGMAAPPSSACVRLTMEQVGALPQELGRLEVEQLESGSSRSLPSKVLTTRRGMPGGFYRLTVTVDCDGEISEIREDNNEAPAEQLVRVMALAEGPDLVLRDLAVSPTTVLVGLGDRHPQIEVGMKISNIGNQRATAFSWAVYLSDDETLAPGTDREIAGARLAGLEASRNEPVRQLVELPDDLAEGSYHIFARVDPDDEVPGETDEFNNDARLPGPLKVLAGFVPGFDLILTSIRIENFQIPMGGSIDVAFTLCNRGTTPILNNFFVTVVLSEDLLYEEDTDVRVG
ncbi:MAG: hypothetical protein FJ125_18055, partial [Deltaproteobacteria bacterium]|nr:hypothetical protein [Deltaproteobacteria bacterium]